MDNLEFGTTVEEELSKNGVYASVTSGISMRPLFKTNRDMVILKRPEAEPSKYDVVLYKNRDFKFVLHRIIGVKDNKFIIRGDNTYSLEYVDKANIIAVLSEFNRKGKRISVSNKGYRLYARVWNFIYPIRFVLVKLISYVKRKCRTSYKIK